MLHNKKLDKLELQQYPEFIMYNETKINNST